MLTFGSFSWSWQSQSAGKKPVKGCLFEVVHVGLHPYEIGQSLVAKDPRISQVLQEIRKVYPSGIDEYAFNFFQSNGKWPTVNQVRKHLFKRFLAVDNLLRRLLYVSDKHAGKPIKRIRSQVKAKVRLLDGLLDSRDRRVYQLGDTQLKHELQWYIHGIAGEIGELEIWFRTSEPVALNYDLKKNMRLSHPTLQSLQLNRAKLLEKLKRASNEEVTLLSHRGGQRVFHTASDPASLRARMLQLLNGKEIDIVLDEGDGKLVFLEVKNYEVYIEDVNHSSRASRKSLAAQLAEVQWLIHVLDMEELIQVGFISTGKGIHPREARKLMQQGIKVFKFE